ncbi:MAG: biotin attachment protein, partial [Spirochaetales bacterium]|nr:biotin attachment protein [Spirochaetales bacterium]
MVEPLIPWSPMPGGALTANTQMLRDNNLMDRYQDIMGGMGEVVRKGGYGTSVTPVSQFYFQQAFNNTMMGEWKKIADGYGKMVLGYFGKTPVEPDSEIVKLASDQLGLEPTTKKVLEINDADDSKGIAPAKKALKEAGLKITDENIFIAATCKEKGITFLNGDAKLGIRLKEKAAPKTPQQGEIQKGDSAGSNMSNYSVTVNGKKYSISIEGEEIVVDGKNNHASIKKTPVVKVVGAGKAAPVIKAPVVNEPPVQSPGGNELYAPMHGKVFKIVASPGDHVSEGDIIIVLEAMKMEMDIVSKVDGVVNDILVELGDQIADGDLVAHIG